MTARRRDRVLQAEFLTLVALICLVVGRGCSKPKVITVPEPKTSEPTACFSPPETANEAVRRVLTGLQHHEVGELLAFLPNSYWKDVVQLVHDFGNRLDQRCWEPFGATCRKARDVLSRVSRANAEIRDDMSQTEKEWADTLLAIGQVMGALGDSRLTDVRELQGMAAGQFLIATCNKAMKALSQGKLSHSGMGADYFPDFGEVKVQLVDSAGDSAVVSVQWPGYSATQHDFIRVEQRWIPQALAESWSAEFPKFRERCLAWADELRSNPESSHARLREIDVLLDELAATKSLAEARQVWESGASRLIVAWFGPLGPEEPQTEVIPASQSQKPVRVKRPDTEVLLPDEPEK